MVLSKFYVKKVFTFVSESGGVLIVRHGKAVFVKLYDGSSFFGVLEDASERAIYVDKIEIPIKDIERIEVPSDETKIFM